MGPPWSDTVGHHALVELAKIETITPRRCVVLSKLEGRHLAEKIPAVRRIVRATHRLLPRRRRRQVRLALEELRGLIDRPRAAVQPEPDDHPADARQRFADLREPVARIVFL